MLGSFEYSCPMETSFDENEHQKDKDTRKLIVIIFLCALFMIAEVIGGLYAGSLAVITDAAHLLTGKYFVSNLDISGFLISLFAITWSRKPASAKLSYGYHRIEILGALFSISIVWALTVFLLIEAINRIRKTEAVDGKIMFITASLGLMVNIM